MTKNTKFRPHFTMFQDFDYLMLLTSKLGFVQLKLQSDFSIANDVLSHIPISLIYMLRVY